MPFHQSGQVDAVALSYSSNAMAPLSPSISRRYAGTSSSAAGSGLSSTPKFSYRSTAAAAIHERPSYRSSAVGDYGKSSYNLSRQASSSYSDRYTSAFSPSCGKAAASASSLSASFDLSKYSPHHYVPNIQRGGSLGSGGSSSGSSSGSSGRSSSAADLLGGDELSSERRREPSSTSSWQQKLQQRRANDEVTTDRRNNNNAAAAAADNNNRLAREQPPPPPPPPPPPQPQQQPQAPRPGKLGGGGAPEDSRASAASPATGSCALGESSPRASTPPANNTELLTTNNNASQRFRQPTAQAQPAQAQHRGGPEPLLVLSQAADRPLGLLARNGLGGESATESPSQAAQAAQAPAGSSAANTTTIESSRPTGRSRLQGSRDERCGLNGLRNIGNTCFMNSVIQCLSNTRPLLEYLLTEQYLADINTTTSSMKGALIKAFSQVIQELWENDGDHVVNTSALKSQIQRFAPRFIGYSQQDAQEFLRYLLEGLHEDVNRVTVKPQPIHTDIPDSYSDSMKAAESWKRYLRSEDSTIVDVFVGQLRSSLRCTVCDHVSVTLDPFWDLSLPIPSRSGTVKLNQCLEHFTREEVLDGDEKPTCSKCQMRRKCTKSFGIQKFPKILVIHLKRFSPMERFRGKLNVLVDFPLTGLDLSAFAAPRVQGCTYNLYGVANHSGTTHSGHYTAYCKHPYSGEWHEYNDSRVMPVSSRSVVSSEGYVLFYEQQPHSSHL